MEEKIYRVIIGFIFFCICLIIMNTWIYYCFVPFYKQYLGEKIRECIIQSRLDSSGRQLYRNMTETDQLLQILQTIEKLFGLDNKPLITSSSSSDPQECIITKYF